ncbi:hypothetical protein ALQ92_200033 [Pseudomonas syringae pv. pisi]|nr:hypothetical protein ALQ92_200033 [Pseudomonas syringae pv. pisi]
MLRIINPELKQGVHKHMCMVEERYSSRRSTSPI